MYNKFFLSIILILSVMFLLSFSAGAVPEIINYQGKLTDHTGIILNGDFTMIFILYDAEINGTLLWSEEQIVTVVDGIFSVQLGASLRDPLSSSLFNNDELYLEIGIYNAVSELTETLSPRQRLTSTAFAMKAANAEMAWGVNWSNITNIPSGFDDDTDDINDADANPTNEIQTLGTSGNEITLTNSVSVIAPYAHDADKVDGQHASEFGDGYSLDAADGEPVDVVYVSDAGAVGIGTTMPGYKLHVISPTYGVLGQGELVGGNFQAVGTNTGIWAVHAIQENIDGFAIYAKGGKNYFEGNTGIGTENPSAKLDVVGTVQATAFVGNGAGLTGIGDGHSLDAADGNPIDAIYVDNYGNVGIGITTPAASLHVRPPVATGEANVDAIVAHLLHGSGFLTSTLRGIYGKAETNSWTGTNQIYGVYAEGSATSSGGSPTNIVYGVYGKAKGTTVGTQTAIGGYFTASGADNNYAAIFDLGNVGIGTSGPAAKLTVNGGILREGSTMYGANSNTHMNLGVSSATGTSGQDYDYCTVSGGQLNTAGQSHATVGGGSKNGAGGIYSTVSGGYDNLAGGEYSVIGGGNDNWATGNYATSAGGVGNWSTANYATVGGGWNSLASGVAATVPGGQFNQAQGDFSFAAGRRARADHQGAFVWADSTDADFTSTGNDQFLIHASGGVGIGTSSPEKNLHISSDTWQGQFRVERTVNSVPSGYWIDLNPNSGTGANEISSSKHIAIMGGNVGIATTNPNYKLHVNGTAYATGAAGALSDLRHKTNIRDLSVNALTIVNELRPVTYEWKEPQDSGMKGSQFGFIAQEVEEVLPEAVLTQDNEEETKGLKYSALIPVLTKAIQELMAENAVLRARIEALEAKVK